jgi:hypothetical protein
MMKGQQMSQFKEVIEILNNLGAKPARSLKFNNTQGRCWVVFVDGVRTVVDQNGKLIVIRYAKGDGWNGEREISTKSYLTPLVNAGFEVQVKKNRLYVSPKEQQVA